MTKYYHGTSSVLPIKTRIYPPNRTQVKREDFRKTINDKVFVTVSLKSAEYYARKSVEKFGGEPLIYEVRPEYKSLTQKNLTEYITDYATIIKPL